MHSEYIVDCINCDGNAKPFLIEPIKCSDCNKIMFILYFKCDKCEFVWKFLNGQVITSLFETDLDKLPPLLDIIDAIHRPKLLDSIDTDETSMDSVIVRCIRCGKVAYETEPNNYTCPYCDFEWESVNVR